MLRHTGTVQIESERLTLRRFIYDDIPHMIKNWIANPKVQHEYGEPVYKTVDEVRELLNKLIQSYDRDDFYRWAIILKENNENIGQIAFCRVYSDLETAEIEYCIGESYTGQGYATEALNAVIDFSFKQPKFYKLEAYHRAANPRSGRVLEKTLMKRVENVRRFEMENIKPEGEVCYGLTIDEYNKYIKVEFDSIIIKNTKECDLDFVVKCEREPNNAQYVGQWTKEQHRNALVQEDILHLIVEDKTAKKNVGYIIIAGLTNSNRNIEFRRFVISSKGKGFGRKSLKLIKKIAFEELKAHRLWLDVREKNERAQNLYKSEGFIEEGILRECILHEGAYESLIVMSILESEYNKGR